MVVDAPIDKLDFSFLIPSAAQSEDRNPQKSPIITGGGSGRNVENVRDDCDQESSCLNPKRTNLDNQTEPTEEAIQEEDNGFLKIAETPYPVEEPQLQNNVVQCDAEPDGGQGTQRASTGGKSLSQIPRNRVCTDDSGASEQNSEADAPSTLLARKKPRSSTCRPVKKKQKTSAESNPSWTREEDFVMFCCRLKCRQTGEAVGKVLAMCMPSRSITACQTRLSRLMQSGRPRINRLMALDTKNLGQSIRKIAATFRIDEDSNLYISVLRSHTDAWTDQESEELVALCLRQLQQEDEIDWHKIAQKLEHSHYAGACARRWKALRRSGYLDQFSRKLPAAIQCSVSDSSDTESTSSSGSEERPSYRKANIPASLRDAWQSTDHRNTNRNSAHDLHTTTRERSQERAHASAESSASATGCSQDLTEISAQIETIKAATILPRWKREVAFLQHYVRTAALQMANQKPETEVSDYLMLRWQHAMREQSNGSEAARWKEVIGIYLDCMEQAPKEEHH